MKNLKMLFKFSIFLGLFILLLMVILVLLDVDASNIVATVPISILGESLFIGGIIGYCSTLVKSSEDNKDE